MTRHRLRNTGKLHYRPRGVGMNVIRDPFSNRAICPGCSTQFTHARLAESCRTSHPPVVPGGTMRPRRPDYVPASSTYVASGERSRRRKVWLYRLLVVLGVVLALGSAAIAGKTLAKMSVNGPDATWVTPTTYGPPGPSGGPR